MDRGDRPNLRYGQFGGRAAARHAPGDRLELPGWPGPRSDLRVSRSPNENGPKSMADKAQWMHPESRGFCYGQRPTASPQKKQKTALAPPRTGLLAPVPSARRSDDVAGNAQKI